ncbi:hypothetical protein [Nitrolancea hollandica]|uniref:Uncharacterized protein n=1 Tax=Nitrolancea hollandica Lb TaxID=1129897 RepID=I4EMB8_9BACT|nr:hypothetical protein [Nitrolancea hollandica]CCF85831.1 hypothetical protein NITHO_5850005 [Nitrolancea hollandica Lb]
MTYSIPEATHARWKKLAADSGLPYATIVNQHLYDIRGLAGVLSEQLERDKQTVSDPSTDEAARDAARADAAVLAKKLASAQAKIAAYEREIASNPPPESSDAHPD